MVNKTTFNLKKKIDKKVCAKIILFADSSFNPSHSSSVSKRAIIQRRGGELLIEAEVERKGALLETVVWTSLDPTQHAQRGENLHNLPLQLHSVYHKAMH